MRRRRRREYDAGVNTERTKTSESKHSKYIPVSIQDYLYIYATYSIAMTISYIELCACVSVCVFQTCDMYDSNNAIMPCQSIIIMSSRLHHCSSQYHRVVGYLLESSALQKAVCRLVAARISTRRLDGQPKSDLVAHPPFQNSLLASYHPTSSGCVHCANKI